MNLEEFNKKNYDYIIFCDGSGETKKSSASYASLIYSFMYEDGKTSFTSTNLLGYNSKGSNNYAELKAVVESLYYIYPECVTKTALIVSDSEITVKGGTGEYQRKANLPFWVSIEYFEKVMKLEWQHVYRNTNKYNKWCDEIAKPFRKDCCDKYELLKLPE